MLNCQHALIMQPQKLLINNIVGSNGFYDPGFLNSLTLNAGSIPFITGFIPLMTKK